MKKPVETLNIHKHPLMRVVNGGVVVLRLLEVRKIRGLLMVIQLVMGWR